MTMLKRAKLFSCRFISYEVHLYTEPVNKGLKLYLVQLHDVKICLSLLPLGIHFEQKNLLLKAIL